MEKEKYSGNIVDLKILKRLFRYVKPYKSRFYLLVFLTLMLGILAPLRPVIVAYTIDNYIAFNDYNGLINMTLILIALLVVQSIVQYFHTFMSGWLGQHIIKDIRVKLYEHLVRLKLRFFDRTPIGRLVTRTISDVETLSDVFSQGMAAMMGDVLQLVFILIAMFIVSWELTLVSLATLPILIFSTYVFKEKIKKSFNEVRNAVSNLNSFVQEHITGMNVVQIFNSEEREGEKFREINREHRNANLKSVLYYSVYFPVAEVIGAIGIGLLIWYGGQQIFVGSNIQFGELVSFIMFINMFFRPIRMIADRFNTLQMGVVSTSRIMRILDTDEHIPDEGDQEARELKGKIAFKNVYFAYNEDEYVLKDISFSVNPGETVALVGATGAGKTSIINLLTRFYDIQKGEICIDGQDIKNYSLSSLRHHIGLVLQDVFLFSDTIHENISLGNPEITLNQMKDAAELVGARKFIERLPGGFEYNVMERGATLSVGQRQLISFVRAMVYDPRILVLDEATSSVDTETEELIQQAIDKMMQGRTALVIAHRLSTIKKADKIIVLEKGRIIEEGSHEELIQLNGHYKHLHEIQYTEYV